MQAVKSIHLRTTILAIVLTALEKRRVVLRMRSSGILLSAACRSSSRAARDVELVTVWFMMRKSWQVGQQMIQISIPRVHSVAIYFCLF